MTEAVRMLRLEVTDREKLMINLGFVDLGHIDLPVQDGFYANRTDFIRTAIRNQIGPHDDSVHKSVIRHQLDLGQRHFSRAEQPAARTAQQKLRIDVLGLATIAADVTSELALASIQSITILGALHASTAGKAVLAGRMA